MFHLKKKIRISETELQEKLKEEYRRGYKAAVNDNFNSSDAARLGKLGKHKRIVLLKAGFFPVTPDFWYGAQEGFFKEADYSRFTWARRDPASGKLMPYSGDYLSNKSIEEILERARLAIY